MIRKLKAARLLFWSTVTYAILLLLIRGIFSSDYMAAISITGVPLVVVTVIIARDLMRRSTNPVAVRSMPQHEYYRRNPVEFLASQLRATHSASHSYFENVILSRLKELLITKVSLETGISTEEVRRRLSDARQGPRILHDDDLYEVLFEQAAESDHDSPEMDIVEDAIGLIGAWKE